MSSQFYHVYECILPFFDTKVWPFMSHEPLMILILILIIIIYIFSISSVYILSHFSIIFSVNSSAS